jgi:hypothetical protein
VVVIPSPLRGVYAAGQRADERQLSRAFFFQRDRVRSPFVFRPLSLVQPTPCELLMLTAEDASIHRYVLELAANKLGLLGANITNHLPHYGPVR